MRVLRCGRRWEGSAGELGSHDMVSAGPVVPDGEEWQLLVALRFCGAMELGPLRLAATRWLPLCSSALRPRLRRAQGAAGEAPPSVSVTPRPQSGFGIVPGGCLLNRVP